MLDVFVPLILTILNTVFLSATMRRRVAYDKYHRSV